VTVAATGRLVGSVTAELLNKYGVTAAGLYWPEPKVRNPDYATPRTFVLEALRGWEGSLQPVPLDGLADRAERDMAYDALNQRPPGPFSRQGWLRDLQSWVEAHARASGLRLTGAFTHLTGDSDYGLVRFETDRLPVWFKVPFPGINEVDITLALANETPDAVLPVLAHHAAWNGFLTRHVESELLGRVWEKQAWCEAARVMARIQVNWAARGPEILRLGARDYGLPAVRTKLARFFHQMDAVFDAQPAEPPVRLNHAALDDLRRFCEEGCEHLGRLPIPESLCHADIAPHNILVAGDVAQYRCLYIDWAGAYLSHPFLPFEHLVSRMKKERESAAAWEQDLRNAYAAEWGRYASPGHVAEAYFWTAPLAALVYALQRFELYDPAYRLAEGGRRLRGLLRVLWSMVSTSGKSGYQPPLVAGVPAARGAP
jgi:hypothetical protein